MQVVHIYSHESYQFEQDCVACIGFFDGVHIGHQTLISTALKQANDNQLIPACITFYEDPWYVIKGIKETTNLMSLEDKLQALQSLGIQRSYVLHFDKTMASMSSSEFIQLLKSLGIVQAVVGEDFRFASKGSGTPQILNTVIPTTIMELQSYHNKKIASSSIEQAIKEGDVECATFCLGTYYQIRGTIMKGNQIGRLLGFPTANLGLNYTYVVPKRGVYAGVVIIDGEQYKAMINIGYNPTLNHKDHLSIEAHILNFNKDVYGKDMTIGFISYIREEQKFTSKKALIHQLQEDVKEVRKVCVHEIKTV